MKYGRLLALVMAGALGSMVAVTGSMAQDIDVQPNIHKRAEDRQEGFRNCNLRRKPDGALYCDREHRYRTRFLAYRSGLIAHLAHEHDW